MYFDLNIPLSEEAGSLISKCQADQWEGFALNHKVKGPVIDAHKCKIDLSKIQIEDETHNML